MMRCRLAPRIAATSTLFAFAFPHKRFNHSGTPQVPKHATTTAALPLKDFSSRYGPCVFAAEDGEETLSPWALHHMVNSPDCCVADVELLIRHGADVNAKWDKKHFYWANPGGVHGFETPLFIAAERGHSNAVKLLLDSGADVNVVVDCTEYRSTWRRTPLHAAALRGDASSVELLINHGADVHAKDRFGCEPLHLAAGVHTFGSNEKMNAIIQLLIASGADVNARDEKGMTPLHHAAERLSGQRVKVLVGAGADLNAVDNKSRTPLHIAATVSKFDSDETCTARALIDAGADLNAVDSKSHTPLYVVALLHGGGAAHAIINGLLAPKVQEAPPSSKSKLAGMAAVWSSWIAGSAAVLSPRKNKPKS